MVSTATTARVIFASTCFELVIMSRELFRLDADKKISVNFNDKRLIRNMPCSESAKQEQSNRCFSEQFFTYRLALN
jgi:hypothetical protein